MMSSNDGQGMRGTREAKTSQRPDQNGGASARETRFLRYQTAATIVSPVHTHGEHP